MRRLTAAGTVIALLAVAATALAAVAFPKGGKSYKGTTSLPKIGKFKDPVTFKTNSNGHTVLKFKFGYLSCQGVGGPPPTTNPYTQPDNVVEFGSMGLSARGSFTGLGFHTVSGTKTTARVKGKFKLSKRRIVATGTLTVRQTFPGGHCGPEKVTFTAKPTKAK